MTIKLLSEETINEIAAGEMIENPASVVKELIENSLDGGAKKIGIKIKGGGFQLIQVSDDGSGMSHEDAPLSLQRYATSKIEHSHDLFHLTTMGFRGEALSSIAAISSLTLITALEGKEGIEIRSRPGQPISLAPCSRSRGTTFEVRDLFHNIPARKKFQKKPSFSLVEIHRVVTSLALAYPDVAFELLHHEEKICSFTPSSLQHRIKEALGEEFLLGASSIEADSPPYILKGYLGSPLRGRRNRLGQHLSVNGRVVYSPGIASAVRQAYGTRLDKTLYPTFVLQIEITPDLIDVNVHPQKREIRFQQEEILKQILSGLITATWHSPAPPPFILTPKSSVELGSPSTLKFREESTPQELPLPEEEFDPITLFDHYLILREQEGIRLVDLLALQEALFFETIGEKKGESQTLLLPIEIPLSPVQWREVDARSGELEEMGFSLRPLGKQLFLIEAIPSFLSQDHVAEVIVEIAQGERASLASLIARRRRRQKKQFLLQEALLLWKKGKKTLPSNLMDTQPR